MDGEQSGRETTRRSAGGLQYARADYARRAALVPRADIARRAGGMREQWRRRAGNNSASVHNYHYLVTTSHSRCVSKNMKTNYS